MQLNSNDDSKVIEDGPRRQNNADDSYKFIECIRVNGSDDSYKFIECIRFISVTAWSDRVCCDLTRLRAKGPANFSNSLE